MLGLSPFNKNDIDTIKQRREFKNEWLSTMLIRDVNHVAIGDDKKKLCLSGLITAAVDETKSGFFFLRDYMASGLLCVGVHG